MQPVFFLSCLVLMSCFARSGYADILGSDDRAAIPATSGDYRFVGKIVSRSTACTATLVRDSVIVTNAHCMIPALDNKETVRFVVYLPNENEATAASDVRVASMGTHTPAMKPEDDWALLTLNEPLGKKVGKVSVRDDRSYGAVAFVSFAADFAFGLTPSIQINCALISPARIDFFGAHTCDSFQGASGAPLLRRDSSGIYLLGINAAGVTHAKNDVFNISVPAYQFLPALESIP